MSFDERNIPPAHERPYNQSMYDATLRWYRKSCLIVVASMCAMIIISYVLQKRIINLRRLIQEHNDFIGTKNNGVSPQGCSSKHACIAALLKCLEHVLPDHLKIETFSYDEEKNILITGIAESMSAFLIFIQDLKKEKCFSRSFISRINQDPKKSDGHYIFTLTSTLS